MKWLCDACAEVIGKVPSESINGIEELRAEIEKLRELVMKCCSDMRNEVSHTMQKSSEEVGVAVEKMAASAVSSVQEECAGDSISDAKWTEVVTGRKKKGKHLLLLKANKKDEKAVDSKTVIANTLEGVPITNSRFTNNGNIVLNFENEDSRSEAAGKLKLTDKLVVSNVKKIMPKILLCNVNKEETENDLIDKLTERNVYLRSIENVGDKMKLVLKKPAAGGTVHFIIKCDPVVRAIIHKHGNKLRLDWGIYNVRDRYYALRCFHCQRFGHVTANCSSRINKEDPICPKCAGGHEIKDCHSDFKKCSNCYRANRSGDIAHAVNEQCCPSLALELRRVKENTDHGYPQ